jgi:hypothetical protein
MRPSVLFSILLVSGTLLLSILLIKQKQSEQPTQDRDAVSSLQSETKEHTGGNVTVVVAPINLKPGEPPSFTVTFNTHSVILDFDIVRNATLTDDRGGTFDEPVWNGSPAGGHHRTGTLSFSSPVSTDATSVTLSFRNIADVPVRTFSWGVSSR